MTDNVTNPDEVLNPEVNLDDDFIVPSKETTDVIREAVQVIEGERVDLHQSAAFTVLAEEANLQESAAFILRAEEVRVQDSVTFILAAGEVRGNITTLFTPTTAAILGAAIMLGMWMLRPRR